MTPSGPLLRSVAFLSIGMFAQTALAGTNLPSGGTIVAGQATIQNSAASQLTITQSSAKAVIDWTSFDIAQNNAVQFIQPDSASITLNRVTGGQQSRIAGNVNANGQFWLLNPNGAIISPTGSVSAAGLLVSTHGIQTSDFMAGQYDFSLGSTNATIRNRGTIITDGGYAILAGRQVVNNGLIEANLGQVVLATGKNFTVDIVGDSLLAFTVTAPIDVLPSESVSISSDGTLRANGGKILINSNAAQQIVDNVINLGGLIEAQSAQMVNGQIVLDGGATGAIRINGTVNTEGAGIGETGGTITITGEKITLNDRANITAAGYAGGGTIYFGNAPQSGSSSGVVPAGNIIARMSSIIDASARNTGNGGSIVIRTSLTDATAQTIALGTISAAGGAQGGNGGQVSISSYYVNADTLLGNAGAIQGNGGQFSFLSQSFAIGAVSPTPFNRLPGAPSRLAGTALSALLDSGTNVSVKTIGGDLTSTAAITKSAGAQAQLSLNSAQALNVSGSVIGQSGFNVLLESDLGRVIIGAGGGFSIDGSLTIHANKGYLSASAGAPTGFANSSAISARDFILAASDVDIGAPITATNTLVIQPFDPAQDIAIGNGALAQASGALLFGDAEFGALHAPLLTIGHANGTGHIAFDVSSSLSGNGPNSSTTLRASGAGGSVSFGGHYSVAAGETLRLLAGSEIILASNLATSVAGRLDLISGDRFTNNKGAAALPTTGSGRWFIRAETPDQASFGGLLSGHHALWGVSYGAAIAASDPATANQYGFGLKPALDIRALDKTKIFGTALSFSASDVVVTGLVDASHYGGVFLQDQLPSGPLVQSGGAAPLAAIGPYQILSTNGAPPAGYTMTYHPATLTVVPNNGLIYATSSSVIAGLTFPRVPDLPQPPAPAIGSVFAVFGGGSTDTDPILAAADDDVGGGVAQQLRQETSSQAVAPGIEIESPLQRRRQAIPGIEERYSGIGDTSRW